MAAKILKHLFLMRKMFRNNTETEDSTTSMEEELENTSNFVDSIIEDMKNAGSDSENE